jgi:hypothetical protein
MRSKCIVHHVARRHHRQSRRCHRARRHDQPCPTSCPTHRPFVYHRIRLHVAGQLRFQMLSRHALLSKREAPTAFSALIVTRCCTSAVFVLGMYCQALVLVSDFAAACVMVLFGKMNLEHLAQRPVPVSLWRCCRWRRARCRVRIRQWPRASF